MWMWGCVNEVPVELFTERLLIILCQSSEHYSINIKDEIIVLQLSRKICFCFCFCYFLNKCVDLFAIYLKTIYLGLGICSKCII